MNTNKNSIITEDGQRLIINEGLINGTEDTGPGLAYETGNVLNEKNETEKNGCPTPPQTNRNTSDNKK